MDSKIRKAMAKDRRRARRQYRNAGSWTREGKIVRRNPVSLSKKARGRE